MGFDKGTVSFRMLAGAPDVDALCEHARQLPLPAFDSILTDAVYGWAGCRHLMDKNVSRSACFRDERLLRLNLVKAERKFPGGRLKAEVQRAIDAAEKERGFLRSRDRHEIKKEVVDQLLPEAPVGLAGIELVYDSPASIVYTDALSETKVDALVMEVFKGGKSSLAEIDAHSVATLKNVNPHDLRPLPFRLGGQSEMFAFQLGREFLTWLLWVAETAQEVDLDGRKVALQVDGPLLLADCTGKNSTVAIKGDAPTLTEECQRALQDGKLLKRARVVLACGDVSYGVNVDADDWTFRGMKLPKAEAFEAEEQFFERMESLNVFRLWWLAAFEQFLSLRMNNVEEFEEACRAWMLQRTTRVTGLAGRTNREGGAA